MDSCTASAAVKCVQKFNLWTWESTVCLQKTSAPIRETMEDGVCNNGGFDVPPLVQLESVKLEGEMEAELDAFEVEEGMMQIRLMVVEAVWKGLVRALEEEASRAVELQEAESLKFKKELQSKDYIIDDLIQALRKKNDELAQVEESRHHKLQGQMTEGKDVASHCTEGKDRSSTLLQREIDLLNCKIEEVTPAHSLLIQEVGNYRAEIEAQQSQISKQGSALHDSERRCQTLVVVVKYLQDKVAVLNSKLLEYEDAALLARAEKEEQTWEHEAEITVVMTILEGILMDLGSELREMVEDTPTNHVEAVTSKSRILQGLSSERENLRSSVGTLETRLEDTQAARRFLEMSMRAEQRKLAEKTSQLHTAESRIAALERELFEKENLLESLQNEVAEVSNSEDSRSLKAKRLMTEQVRLESSGESFEEKVCLVDTEKMFRSSDMETASPVVSYLNGTYVWSLMTIMQRFEGDLVGRIEQHDSRLQQAHETLKRLKTGFEGQVQTKKEEDVTKLREAMEESNWRSQVENLLILGYGAGLCQQMTDMREQLAKKILEARNKAEHESRQLQEALEESEWRNQVENLLILGYGEGLCQQITDMRQQLEEKSLEARNEAEHKSRQHREALEESEWRNQVESLLTLGYGEGMCQQMVETVQRLEKKSLDARNEAGHHSRRATELENEVSRLRYEIALLKDESLVNARHVKVVFEGQSQSLMTLIQRLEGVIAGKVEQFDSRLQNAHYTLKQMRTGFEGQIQNVMASAERLEGHLAGKVKQFQSRLQHAHDTLKQATQSCCQTRVREAQYFQDLQKAETEVDCLGDEVDALMDVLEKVYTVLTHYHPVIQLYPGLAELSKLVKEEVLERVCSSDVVSV